MDQEIPEYIPTDWMNRIPDYQQAYNPYKYDLTDLTKFTPSGIYRHDHMINNCTTLEEELHAVNLDHMSTIEIDELFYSIFNRQTLDEEDERQDPDDYFSAQMMCMKKNEIAEYYLDRGDKVICTWMLYNTYDFSDKRHHPKIIRIARHEYLQLSRYRQSRYWVDTTHKLLFRNPSDLTVIGKIDFAGQPYPFVDAYAYSTAGMLGLSCDEYVLDASGRMQFDAFMCTRNKYVYNHGSDDSDIEF
jgi:hypothetical protein